MSQRFFVWCLTWEESEDEACEVIPYDPISEGWQRDEKQKIWAAFKPSLTVVEAAETAAEHYHVHRSGWEASWPLRFRVKAATTGEIFDIDVEREVVPRFSGTVIKPAAAAP